MWVQAIFFGIFILCFMDGMGKEFLLLEIHEKLTFALQRLYVLHLNAIIRYLPEVMQCIYYASVFQENEESAHKIVQ
jgi:hypothetical protein